MLTGYTLWASCIMKTQSNLCEKGVYEKNYALGNYASSNNIFCFVTKLIQSWNKEMGMRQTHNKMKWKLKQTVLLYHPVNI